MVMALATPIPGARLLSTCPGLCAKYMQPGELEWRIANHNDTWNPTSEEIQMARATEKKGVKI